HQDAEISGESFYAADGVGAHGLKGKAAAFFFDKNGNRAKRLEDFLHGHGAGAWTAAAVRRGKCFVQIEVHDVDPEVTRARDAGEGVHVSPVHIEQRALRMENLGNFRDALLEDAERRRIGDHQRGDVGRNQFAQFVDVDLAVRFGLYVFDFVARYYRGGGIGPVRGIGNQDLLARIALLLEVRADQQQTGELALRAGGGLQSDGVHAGDFEQALLEQAKDFQAALRKLLRLVGMLGGDAVKSRPEFVDPRVVLHGAGAEGIHAEVDRVVPGGEAREVANDFDFADFGESLNALAAVILAESFGGIAARHLERRKFESAFAGRGLLEDEPFVLVRVAGSFFDSVIQTGSCPCGTAICGCSVCSGYKGCSKARRTAPANFSMSERVVVSVTQTSACLVSSGYEVPSTTGPTIFSRRSSALTIFTERGNSSVNSLKKGAAKARRTPGILVSSASAKRAFERFCCAISRSPSLPSSVR